MSPQVSEPHPMFIAITAYHYLFFEFTLSFFVVI
jgi:hypothetical protein